MEEHYLNLLPVRFYSCLPNVSCALTHCVMDAVANERVADEGLLIAVCRHIIIVTLELCSCVLTLSALNH
jgi:hypothetical protein